jgi:hypothetical protein
VCFSSKILDNIERRFDPLELAAWPPTPFDFLLLPFHRDVRVRGNFGFRTTLSRVY